MLAPIFSGLVWTYWIILERGDIGLYGALHVPSSHQGGGQVDVSVNEVRLESDRVSVVVQSLLQLSSLFEHVAKVGVGLGQHGVLFDGQCGEVGRLVISPALEVYRGEEQENPRVGGILSPELHRVFLRILIIPRLK